ncbi:biotin synthase [Ruegeria marisrubri]|uniref:Biotin synthase n=1 Tax=Ruegeria marisrubri TaxID=1685379 RepID=A0A0X3TCB4_9RHOB|nr:methyltransferase domain-containing protein [Ruegeria marisrubri]KUJ73422.1 biotin synthase [Ruegeria marisrubri]
MKDHLLPETSSTRVGQCFRRGLGTYHQAARAQAQISRDLAGLLAECGAPEQFGNVLEFGCGTGHLTEALLQRFSIGALTLNDLVAEAAELAGAAARKQGVPLRFVAGPVETLRLPQEYDLIASASTVQWLPDLPEVLERLCASLGPGGWLALSGFGTAQFRELAALGSAAAAPNYLNVGDWPGILPPGLELKAIRQQPIVLEFPTAVDVLRHLRATGVNGRARDRWSKQQLRSFESAYRERFERNGMLSLTYDPVMLVARKR